VKCRPLLQRLASGHRPVPVPAIIPTPAENLREGLALPPVTPVLRLPAPVMWPVKRAWI